MSTQDILPSVHSPLPLLILDSILYALTHPNTLKRRTALALFFLYLIISIRLLSITRHHFTSPSSLRRTSRNSISLKDDDLPSTVSTTTSIEQRDNLARLIKLIDSRESSLPPSRFTPIALDHPSNKDHYVAVTAVVLHWKRRKGLQLVLKQLSKYPFIREIIVWNNHPGVDLTKQDFLLSPASSSDLPKPKLRIFNSPSNVHDLGKHYACSLASNDHCYFNDDDWLNVYLDAQYTKYIECCLPASSNSHGFASRIVSNTMPYIHWEHRRWRFDNPDISLHTGFTWLGTGSFAPKTLSVRFLDQQSTLPVGLTRDQTLVSDMFFSIWANVYHEQMPNDLVPIDVEGEEVGWSKGVDQWSIVYGNILDGIRKLYDVLTVQDPYLTPSPFPLTVSPPESQLRAPCSTDDCLFMTSLSPFPPLSSLTYSSPKQPSLFSRLFSKHSSRKTRLSKSLTETPRFDPFAIDHLNEHEARFEQLEGWPDADWWVKNGSWHLAVDGKDHDQTCWTSHRPPSSQDYFGLHFTRPIPVTEFSIVGSPSLSSLVSPESLDSTNDSWQIYTIRQFSIPHEVGGWEPRRIVGNVKVKILRLGIVQITGELEAQEPSEAEIELDQDDPVVRITKMKFVSKGLKTENLSVCGFELDGSKL